MDSAVYRIYTYHGTQVLLTSDRRLIHWKPEDVWVNHLPVYARLLDDGAEYFVIKDNRIMYLDGLLDGRDSNTPIRFDIVRNNDETISIKQGDRFLTARRESDRFEFSTNNLAWEHYRFERVEFELTGDYMPPSILPPKLEFRSEVRRKAPIDRAPKVSVIIPMYNTENFIEATLNSVLFQTLQDYEVIVVDDCSTDRSAEIVEGMIDRFNGKLKLIRLKKNNGEPGTPRNIGLSYATGKYVYFLDSDDMFMNNALETLYNIAEEHHADSLLCATLYAFWSDESKVSLDKDNFQLNHHQFIDGPIFDQFDLGKRVLDFVNWKFGNTPWNKFARRDFLIENEVRFAPTFSVEDAVYTFMLACSTKIHYRINDTHLCYRIRSGSMTSKSYESDKQIAKQIDTIQIVYRMLEEFMGKRPFFDAHPQSRYLINKYFFDYHVRYVANMSPHYENNSASMLNGIIYDIISEGVDFSDELLASCLVSSNSREKELVDRDRRIAQLQKELDALKSQSQSKSDEVKQ